MQLSSDVSVSAVNDKEGEVGEKLAVSSVYVQEEKEGK